MDQEALINGKTDRAINKILAARRELLWDKASLHPDRDKYVIVERILEFGTEEEAAAVIHSYGHEFIKEVIKESPNLSHKTVNYFSMIFNIPRENSRCFSDASRRIWQPF